MNYSATVSLHRSPMTENPLTPEQVKGMLGMFDSALWHSLKNMFKYQTVSTQCETISTN